MTETVIQAYKPPDIPSKWDIIPVHSSDRGSFKRCRRYWNWSSPTRQNLMLRADTHGINTNFWFGTGIHWALEQYYTPGLRRDPVEAWKTWFDIQWRGGVVTEDWLDKVYDLKPRHTREDTDGNAHVPGSQSLWVVRGLEDILPDADSDKYDELYELGVGMMTYYKDYAERNDDFDVILTEHNFSVPIWDYDNDRILKMVDIREDSPNFGKALEVHARGRVDNVWVSNDKLGIIDYKTAAKIDEDYFEKLETDEQCTNYLYCLEVEANYYDLPHKGKPIEEVLYVALRKAVPRPPTMLKSGMFSTNRTDESTTIEMLEDFIKYCLPGVRLDEKQQAYVDYVRDTGDEQFIVRKHVRRNRHQIANAGKRLYLEALDMLSTPLIYPNITNDYNCLRCQFRPPCLALEDGGDHEQLIRDNYTTNKDR